MKFFVIVQVVPGHDILELEFRIKAPSRDAARRAVHKAMEQLGFALAEHKIADVWLDTRP